MHEQNGWINDVSTYWMKFLKYEPSWHQIENICHFQLENNLIKVKVQGAPNVVDSHFTTTFNCNFKLVRGKMCCKSIVELKA
jgi:hypothetical protein